MQMGIPSLNGYTQTYANVGETSNIGVDITLNTMNIRTRDFEWATSLNVAWQKDKIEELAMVKKMILIIIGSSEIIRSDLWL